MRRDGNDAGIILCADLGTEVPVILRKDGTTFGNCNVVNDGIFGPSAMQVMLNVFYVEVLIEARVPLSWLQVLVEEYFMAKVVLRHGRQGAGVVLPPRARRG